MWVVVLVVVAVVGVQGLSEWGKPFTVDRVIPSLETALQQLAQCAQNTPQQAKNLASKLGMFYKKDHVRVVVEADDSLSANKINRLGGEVLARTDVFNLLEVDIPAVGLLELARLPGVSFVRRAYHPVPLVVSEGVQVTGAEAWQQAGYLGQGVRVAVIDAEFGGLSQAIAAGEIDRVIFSHDYTDLNFFCLSILGHTPVDTRVILMTGHRGTAVIHNNYDPAAAIMHHIHQGRHSGMEEGGVSDGTYCIFRNLRQGDPVQNADTGSHSSHGMLCIKRRHATKIVATNITSYRHFQFIHHVKT